MWDVVILGEGPAGVSAALYIQRAGLSSAVIGIGPGALAKAEKIENFYGFAQGVTGKELHDLGIDHAKKLGAEMITDEVVGMDFDGAVFELIGKKGKYQGKAVLLATGTARVTPKIAGLKELEGHGVSYCAVCDGFFYKGKDVAVLGEGEYALHEAEELTHVANSVTIVTNGKTPVFSADVAKGIAVDERKIKKIKGANAVEAIAFESGDELAVNGLFVAVGTASAVDFAKKMGIETNGANIMVNDEMQTNVPGIYAAGDCTGGILQVSTAVAEGAKAGAEIIKYIRAQKK